MPFIRMLGSWRALASIITLLPCVLQAQNPARPPYLDQRFDEDWSFLRDPARHTDPWDSWKFISFGERAPNSSLSIGGEARIRWDFAADGKTRIRRPLSKRKDRK